MRWKRLGFLLFCIVFVFSWPSADVSAQGDAAREVIRLVNGVRTEQGLPPFRINSALSAAAQNQAAYMAANNIYSHTGAGGSTPYTRAVAAGYSGRVSENIVGGTGMTPQQGIIWWINSPIHYQTMTTPTYIEIGAGFANGFGQNFYAIVVGLPSDAPASSNPATDPSDPAPAPIIVTPIPLSPPAEDGSIRHTLTEGQALWTLAAYYEVDTDYLLRINNLKETDFVQPGDVILIRLADGQPTPSPFPTPTPPLNHVVQEGQTLWSIAAKYKLDLPTILWLNSLDENAIVRPGDEVVVRLLEGQSPPPTPTPPLFHLVQSGDVFWSIAVRYGLSLEQLLELNNLQEDAILQPGDEIFIRAQAPTESSVEAAANTPTPTANVATATPATPVATRTPTQFPATRPPATQALAEARIAGATPVPTPEAGSAVDSAETPTTTNANTLDDLLPNIMIVLALVMLALAFFVRRYAQSLEE